MSKTKQEIRQRVGEELGLVEVGQNLESQDQARIDATYDEAYEYLKEKGLAAWAFSGSVPNKLVPYFALFIEEKLLIGYSVPESRYVRITTEAGENGAKALLKISELVVQEYTSNDEPQDF